MLSRTKREVWAEAQAARVLSAPINAMEDLHADPVFAERGVFAEADHPSAGRLRYPGRPFVMERTPWSVRRPAPLLGQHTLEMLEELGYTAADAAGLRDDGVV